MEKDLVVSIWLGRFESEEDLEDYTRIDISPEGEEIRSKFQEDFGIEQYGYDMDFSDVFLIDNPESIEDLLIGASYSESFMDEIEEWDEKLEKDYNSVIAVYDYEYDQGIQAGGRADVDFIGTVPYEKRSWYDEDDCL